MKSASVGRQLVIEDVAMLVGADFDPQLAAEADQLLLPRAVAGGGSFFTSELSEHTRTNLDTINQALYRSAGGGALCRQRQAAKGWRIGLGAEA